MLNLLTSPTSVNHPIVLQLHDALKTFKLSMIWNSQTFGLWNVKNKIYILKNCTDLISGHYLSTGVTLGLGTLGLMGPSLGNCFHLSRTGHLPFFVWDPHTALYLQIPSSDVTSSTLNLYGYARTASGAQMSVKQPSQQVQSPFYSELLPPYWSQERPAVFVSF